MEEVKTEFKIIKKPWLDRYERFYLKFINCDNEITLDFITGNIDEYTIREAKEILFRNIKNMTIEVL